MKKLVLFAIVAFFLVPSSAYTHPGRTASDGCHYCRTNCEKWGVPKGARHCHGKMEENTLSEINDTIEKKIPKANEKKEPGWEYLNRVKKTGTELPKR